MAKRHLLLLILFMLLTAWRAEAQFTPQGFNYQCIVRDDNGASMNNQTVTLLFTVRSGTSNGPVAYSETQTTSTNEFGLVNLIIGQGTPLQGTFNSINWGGGAKFLTISVETSPNVFDELGSTQLMSVPYALYSQAAANGGDDWGGQSAQTAPTLSGNGTAGAPLTIAQQGAANGQVLKWNGTTWVPQDDVQNPGTITIINTGAGLTGGPITDSGTIALENTGVAPGVYGSATQIPVITVDQTGRVTEVFNVVPTPPSIGITGSAGINVQQTGTTFTITNTGDTDASDDITTASQANGDITGPFSNLQIKADAVGSPEIADNSVGTSELDDNAVTSIKLANSSVTTGKLANGAVTAEKLNDMGAAAGQVLKWNGAGWEPAVDNILSLTAGAGISVTGVSPDLTITNTGDTNPNDDLTTFSQANGDVTGPFSDLQLKSGVVGATELAGNAVITSKINPGAVTGDKIAQMSANSGQVLKWDGTSWSPANDIIGSVTISGGVGIDVIAVGNNYTIANGGDVNPFDDITINTPAGGDISGTFDNLQIKQNVITNFEMANNAIATANIQNEAVNGAKIAQMNAFTGQVLKWNGTVWAPALDDVGVGGDNWGTQVAIVGTTLVGNGANVPIEIAQQGASNGQILKWNNTSWAPANDTWGNQVVLTGNTLSGNGVAGTPLDIAQQGASNGQVLKWNGTTWAPANDNNTGGDDWGAQVAVTNPTIAGNGTPGDPLRIAPQSATINQVLKWNGTLWAPADDNDSGGDDWGAQVATTGSTLTGDGAGTPLDLAPQGATSGQVLKFDGSTWAPADDNDSGGDDWGAQVATTGSTLTGDGAGTPLDLAPQNAANGQVLKWNGSSWIPQDDNIGSGPADNWGTQVAITDATLAGDGTAGNPLSVAPQGATTGQVLQWDGATWAPATPAGDNWGTQVIAASTEFIGNGTAGDPLELAPQGASFGQVLKWMGTFWAPGDDENTGDNWGVQAVESSNEFSGSGTLVSPLTLAQQGAASGQVLKWNGSAWAPENDLTGASFTYAAGTGITITGTPPDLTINNAGDLSNTNELQSLSLTGNNLTLSNGGGTVALNDYSAGAGIDITGTAPNFTIVNTGDADSNPTNEIQTLSLAGNDLSLSNGGGTVTLPSGGDTYSAGAGIDITGTAPNFTVVNTGDLDETNELQTISLAGNDLTLSNGGGTVTLPSGGNNYTAGAGINITGTAPDLTIENTGDADADPANELQTISLNGTTLKISGTNAEVKLDTVLNLAGVGFWGNNGANIYNTNAGNVGIGINMPATKLHVKADGEVVRLQGNDVSIGFADGTGKPGGSISKGAGLMTIGTVDSSSILLATAGGKALVVNGTTGNVTVGDFGPNPAKLAVYHDQRGLLLQNINNGANWEFRVSDLNGSLQLYNSVLGPGFPAGTFATNGVYTPSDRRLKKDISLIPSVLDNLLRIEPVYYRYKPESADAPLSLGFLAQDVQAVFPELVGQTATSDGSTYLGLNYAGFGVLAVKAVQEQQKEIESLKQENNNLRSRLDALEARILQVENAPDNKR